MKKIALLGATGSIGTSTLDVIRANPEEFQLVSFTFHQNIEKARMIIKEFAPSYVGVGTAAAKDALQHEFPTVKFGVAEQGLIEASVLPEIDIVLTAVSGSIGLKPTMAAIEAHKTIALANKETLVMAGQWVMAAAKEHEVQILPVDSEHSAIFQCLQGSQPADVRELMITASGGSFRDLSRAELQNVTLAEALSHPNWSMGQKITIDSSTMVNKGLEVIEAHWLFDMDYDRIRVVLHKESIVHSMVIMTDGAYLAQLGASDMREPIQYALTYPRRMPMQGEKPFDLTEIGALHFQKMDFERFPMLALAYEVGRKGGVYATVYNAANEIAANAFINGRISYLQIEKLVERAVEEHVEPTAVDLDRVIAIDQQTREKVINWIKEEGTL